MNTYSQNREDLFIANYFGDFKGNLLSIGENDGRTFSNALAFIEMGWSAHLVEPSSVCLDLCSLHGDNPCVHVYNFGLGNRDETVTFFESGAHVPNGKDKALVSTIDKTEMKRWPNVKFTEKTIELVSWETFMVLAGSNTTFDFISIDAEGNDLAILRQIDLSHTRCLIIEWNGVIDLKKAYQEICLPFGLHVAYEIAENLIFCR